MRRGCQNEDCKRPSDVEVEMPLGWQKVHLCFCAECAEQQLVEHAHLGLRVSAVFNERVAER